MKKNKCFNMKESKCLLKKQLRTKLQMDRSGTPLCLSAENNPEKNRIARPFRSVNAVIDITLTFVFSIIMVQSRAQENDSTEYYFRGQFLDADSMPVENVYLANYRTIKLYASNEKGMFKVPVLPGDSLKTAHISFESIVVKACPPDSIPVYILSYEIHEIGGAGAYVKRYRDLAKEKALAENFNRNWDSVLKSMQNQGCFVTRGDGKRPGSEDALVGNFGLGGRNPSVGLSPEAIYKKIKRLGETWKSRRQRKKNSSS